MIHQWSSIDPQRDGTYNILFYKRHKLIFPKNKIIEIGEANEQDGLCVNIKILNGKPGEIIIFKLISSPGCPDYTSPDNYFVKVP